MVRYMTMKRITQILASALFVITVLTLYLVFDFALGNAVLQKTSIQKRTAHLHEHDPPHGETKSTRKRSLSQLLFHDTRKSNQTIKHHDEHQGHNVNQKRHLPHPKIQLRAKPGNFHKGKTGVKVNKPAKSLKEKAKRLSTLITHSQHKDKHHN